MEINKNYNESNLETMARMPDCFLDLTVTSPPYDNLRNYNGYSFDFENITKELYRVTKNGGVCVWIVADQTKNFSESGTSFKQALEFMAVGWNLFDTMIWEKRNYMPGHKERYADAFEYMFVFSKGKPKTFNPIKIKCITAGKSKKWAARPHESKIWKENGTEHRKTLEYKIKSNIWKYATGRGGSTNDDIAFKHPAIFPEKLVADHITSWTNEGDLVYDCFMGSGTTAKAAISANRNWIGSEISTEYCQIIEQRLMPLRNNLFFNGFEKTTVGRQKNI